MRKLLFVLSLFVVLSSCGISKDDHEATVAKYEKQIEEVEKEKIEIEEESEEKSKKIKSLKKEVKEVTESYDKEAAGASSFRPEGVYYRIQLGAIKNASTDPKKDQFLIKEGDHYKWRIGFFPTYNEAKLAIKDLDKFGIKKYWIVPMIDGVVISHEQARKQIEISKEEEALEEKTDISQE